MTQGRSRRAGSRRTPGITIRGDTYAFEKDGVTEIGDLHHAVKKKRAEVIAAFLADGVSRQRIGRLQGAAKAPRRPRSSGPTEDAALIAAIREGSLAGARKALAAGAVPLQSTPHHENRSGIEGGATALSMAIERDHLEIARLLATRVDGGRQSRAAVTAMFAAAGARRAAYLELLAGRRFRFTWRGGDGRTLLHVAANIGVPASIKLLIAAGADPNARDRERATPLHWAVQNGKTANVRALLRGGADASLKDKYRRNALATARAYEAPPALVALLER